MKIREIPPAGAMFWNPGDRWELDKWVPRYPYSPNRRDRVYFQEDQINFRSGRGLPLAEGFTPGNIQSTRRPIKIDVVGTDNKFPVKVRP